MTATAATTGTTTTDLLAQLFAGAFLAQASAHQEVRRGIAKLKTVLGNKTPDFLNNMKDVQATVLALGIDEAIIGTPSPESLEMLGKLSAENRMLAEMLYARLTGKYERSDNRWAPPLWRLRTMAEEFLGFSPTNMSKEDAAKVVREVGLKILEILRDHFARLLK